MVTETAGTVAQAAAPAHLDQWAGDHAGLLLAALAAGAVALKLRPKGDPLTRAYKRLAGEARRFEANQGRVGAAGLRRLFPCPPAGLPVGYAPPEPWRPWRRRPPYRPVGVPWDADRGHLLVVAPSRSGKSFHQTDTLLRFPGPALVVDPKREQWKRTAGSRAARGPVWEVPAVGLDLAALFDLAEETDRRELFECLWRPWRDSAEGRIFTERTYPLIECAYHAGLMTEQNPVRLLARWARMAPKDALAEAQPHAPEAVNVLTDGTALDKLTDNRFFLSGWGTFTSRWAPLVKSVDVLATAAGAGGVPADWAARNGTIYLCYGLHAQGAAGPLIAAIVAGLVRHLQARPAGRRALLSLDEAPAVGVPGLSHYLSTLGGSGSGVTCVVYTQSLPALVSIYGPHEARSIVGNCSQQVWHRPQDDETAAQLSRIFGETCEVVWNASSGTSENHTQGAAALVPSNHSSGASAGASLGTRYRPALNVAEVMALGDHEVLILLLGKRSRLASSYAVWKDHLRALPPPPEVPAREAATVEPTRQAAGAAQPAGATAETVW
jgi:hypothetical protein